MNLNNVLTAKQSRIIYTCTGTLLEWVLKLMHTFTSQICSDKSLSFECVFCPFTPHPRLIKMLRFKYHKYYLLNKSYSNNLKGVNGMFIYHVITDNQWNHILVRKKKSLWRETYLNICVVTNLGGCPGLRTI